MMEIANYEAVLQTIVEMFMVLRKIQGNVNGILWHIRILASSSSEYSDNGTFLVGLRQKLVDLSNKRMRFSWDIDQWDMILSEMWPAL